MATRIKAMLGIGMVVASACTTVLPSAIPTPAPTISTAPSPGSTDPVTACATPVLSPEPSGAETVLLGDSRYTPQLGPDGGSVIVGETQRPSRFNPVDAASVGDLEIAAATNANLADLTSDFKVMPNLAVDVPTIQNGRVSVPGVMGDAMTAIWCLRDGLRWSDGAPLTCSDFQYTLTWLHDVASPSVAARYGDLRDIECPAPNVLLARYGAPFAGYFRAVPPLPRHYLEHFSTSDLRAGAAYAGERLASVPISGAFRFRALTDTGVALRRNDYFAAGTRGRPSYLDALAFRWYPSDASLIAGFKAGQVDIAAHVQISPDDLAQAGVERNVLSVPSTTYETVRLNWSRGPDAGGRGGCSTDVRVRGRGPGCPVADQAIRAALSAVIDRDAVSAAVAGSGISSYGSLVSPDAYFYLDQSPSNIDLHSANESLQAAGWIRQANGIRAKDNLLAKVELCTPNDARHIDAAQLIVNEASQAGIQIVVHAVPGSMLTVPFATSSRVSPCAISRGNFDLALQTLSSSLDPVDYRLRYSSSSMEPNGSNDAGISDPVIDRALDAASNTADFVVTKRAMADFQTEATKQVVEIPIVFRLDISLVAHSSVPGGVVNVFEGASVPIAWNAVDWFVMP
jgi:peptide/nickel transport system substrate-binding protein